MTKLSDYKQHMFRIIPSLQVLDSHNRYGELVFSDDEDGEGFGDAEGGEDEFEEQEPMRLDEDMMEELRMRGISVEDYMKKVMGAEAGEDDLDDEFSNEGEGEGKGKDVY